MRNIVLLGSTTKKTLLMWATWKVRAQLKERERSLKVAGKDSAASKIRTLLKELLVYGLGFGGLRV